MSELSLLNLKGSGVNDITIVNRTVSKAETLANNHGVSYASIDSLPALLTDADMVISSTSSSDYIITNSMMQSIASQRKMIHLYSSTLRCHEMWSQILTQLRMSLTMM